MVSNMCSSKKVVNDETKFDMGLLRANLPQKRKGLSAYYSGKSQSFTCLADVHCLEDLKKPEIPKAKKRKYRHRQITQVPAFPCREMSNNTHMPAPFVGF
ncbi:hypothetical protein ACHQM5_015424 [Ranunculus cassubicifolius]